MNDRRQFSAALALTLGVVAGCATLQKKDPLQVTVAGIQPLQGQGMELRLLVKLRVQNPNDAPIDYDGVSLTMDVQGKTLASGVSDTRGTVARFGEAVIEVPVTISGFRMARQALGMMKGGGAGLEKISYEMSGKLNGSGFSTVRFKTRGEFELPTGPAEAPAGG